MPQILLVGVIMFSKKYFQTVMLALCLAFGALSFLAQAVEKSAADENLGTFVIKTESGYLVVHNREKDSYSLEFKGEALKPLKSDHPVFVIDGKLVQVVSVPHKNYWKPKADAKNEPTTDELLESHKVWETDYLGSELNAKLSPTSEIFDIERKRKVMYWSFPMPAKLNSDFSHQVFLTTLIGKDILGLNASPKSGGEQKAYRDYLVESMNTLKVSSKPFNIKELQEFLKKGDLAE
jgi:hypothetical protein